MATDENGILSITGRGPSSLSPQQQQEINAFIEGYTNRFTLPKVDEMMRYYLSQIPTMVSQMVEAHGSVQPSAPSEWHTSADGPESAVSDAQHADLGMIQPDPAHVQ